MIRKEQPTLLSIVQRIADGAIVVLVLYGLTVLLDIDWTRAYSLAAMASVLFFILAAELEGLYQSMRGASLVTEMARVGKAWIWTILGLLTLAWATKTLQVYSRKTMGAWIVMVPMFVSYWRSLIRMSLRSARATGRNQQRAAIVGTDKVARHLGRRLQEQDWLGIQLVGWFDDDAEVGSQPLDNVNSPVLGNLSDLPVQAKEARFDRIYVCLPFSQKDRIQDLLRDLADTAAQVYLVPDFFLFDLASAQWQELGGMPIVSVYATPLTGFNSALKRAEDILISLLFLTLGALPMIFVALLVKLSSKGPVLFKQRRYGIGGEKIWVWKFRSMKVQDDGPNVPQAQRDDPRTTSIGGFIRKTSLDELPQLFNVLQGRMSMVGPRPHAVAHNEHYRKLIPGYMLRHMVKPGITGWAQVNGWRGETDTLDKMEKRIQFDLEYVRNWSIFLDLKIVLRTFLIVVGGKNAY